MPDLAHKRGLASARLHSVADVILVCTALVACSLLAYRQFFAKGPDAGRALIAPVVEELQDGAWSSLKREARWLTPNHGGVEVIVFIDVECPFCRRFDESLRKAAITLGDSISIGAIHYPLSQHRFATVGAKALECTSSDTSYRRMLTALFRDQDSLGIKSWGRFAKDAAEADTAAFMRCVTRQGMPPAIDAGRRIGSAVGVDGTPTVIVAGWKLSRVPTLEQLVAIVRSVSRGHTVEEGLRATAPAELR